MCAGMNVDELYAAALEMRMLAAIVAKTGRRALEQRPALAQAGISGRQFWILHALSCEEQTISELSHTFMLDPSTLVPAVDALERKGLVKRGRDLNDRRRVPLSLTEQGNKLVACAAVVDENDPLVEGLGAMGDEQRHQLLTLLRDLLKQMMPEGEECLQRVSSRVRMHITGEPTSPANVDNNE